MGVVGLYDNPEAGCEDGVVEEHAGDNRKNPAVMIRMNSDWMDFSNFGTLRNGYKPKHILNLTGRGYFECGL